MPVEDPLLSQARRDFVQKILSQQLQERQLLERDFANSYAAVQKFLSQSKLDFYIRQTLVRLGRSFKFTKAEKDQIPLDGHFVRLYRPAFVVEHHGLIGFTKSIEYPGLKYSFYINLDEVVITLNLCLDTDNQIIPYISFTHRNGRTHQIDRESSLINPSDEELSHWLDLELYDFLPSRELFEMVMLGDFHENVKKLKFD